MAVCKHCELEMLDLSVETCPENKLIEFPDGTFRRAVKYTNDSVPKAEQKTHRCHDCNVMIGGYHHPGCDMERCPKCKGQLISCSCFSERAEMMKALLRKYDRTAVR